MPRHGPFIHQVYIADGFADDCDELIHRCLNVEKIDYQHFCKIWKEMNMGCLYEGRTLGAEIAELSEEVIHIGKHYMLKDTSNFEESAIGVFIVYALLHLQPYKGFAPLRVVLEDLPAINRLERVARREKRYDVLYALGSILIKGPVQYHATEREYGMDLPVRKYLEGFTSIDKLGVRPKGVFRRQNEELDILKELHILTQRYTQAKMMISEKAIFDRNLQYINPNLPKELEAALMKLITGIHEDQYEIIGEGHNLFRGNRDDSNKISRSRRAIKERAMKQEVKPVRHLVHQKTRQSSTVTSDSLKNEGKTSRKVTKESPKKQATKRNILGLKSERKRRIPISPRAVKRNVVKSKPKVDGKTTTDSDESDIDLDDLSDKSDTEYEPVASSSKKVETAGSKKKGKGKKSTVKDSEIEEVWIKNNKAIKDEESDLGLKGKKIVVASADTELSMSESVNLTENEEENEQELDIEIDTLPVIIRTEDEGKLFEIEIIDNLKPPVNEVSKLPLKTYKKASALKTISLLPGVSIEKIAEPSESVESEPVASTSSANQYAIITEIHERKKIPSAKKAQDKQELRLPISTVEKKVLKRVHLQSKLKRLGMLPIASFDVVEDAPEESDDKDSNNESQGTNDLAPIED